MGPCNTWKIVENPGRKATSPSKMSQLIDVLNCVGEQVPAPTTMESGVTVSLSTSQPTMGPCNNGKIVEPPRRKANPTSTKMSQLNDVLNCVGVKVPTPTYEESGVAMSAITSQPTMGPCNNGKIVETPCCKANLDQTQMSEVTNNSHCVGVKVPAPTNEESGVAIRPVNVCKSEEEINRRFKKYDEMMKTEEEKKREEMMKNKIWQEEVDAGVVLIHGGPNNGKFIVKNRSTGERKLMDHNPYAPKTVTSLPEQCPKNPAPESPKPAPKPVVNPIPGLKVLRPFDPKPSTPQSPVPEPFMVAASAKPQEVNLKMINNVKTHTWTARKFDPKTGKLAKNPAVADNSVRAEIAKEQGIKKQDVPEPDELKTRARRGKRGRQGEKRRTLAKQRNENYEASRKEKTTERKKKQLKLATHAVADKCHSLMVKDREKNKKSLPPTLHWQEMLHVLRYCTGVQKYEYRGVPSAKNLEKWDCYNVISYALHNLNDPKRLRAAVVYFLQVMSIPKSNYFDISRLSKRAAAKQAVIMCFSAMEYRSDGFCDYLCELESYCAANGEDGVTIKGIDSYIEAMGKSQVTDNVPVGTIEAAGLLNPDGSYPADFDDDELATLPDREPLKKSEEDVVCTEPTEEDVQEEPQSASEMCPAGQTCSCEVVTNVDVDVDHSSNDEDDPEVNEIIDQTMRNCYSMMESIDDNKLMSVIQAHGPVDFVIRQLTRLIVNPCKSICNYLAETVRNFVGDALTRFTNALKSLFANLGLNWLWETFLAMLAMIREAAEEVIHKIEKLLSINAAKDVMITIVICFTVFVLYKIFRTMWSAERATKLVMGSVNFANASPASYVMPVLALVGAIVPAGNYVTRFLSNYKALMTSSDAVASVDTLLSWLLPQSILSAISNNPADSEFAMLTGGYNTIIAFANCAEVLLDPTVISYIDSYLTQCQNYLVKYKNDKTCATVNSYYRDVAKISRDVTRHITTAGVRMEPVCVRLFGKSGIGKSKAVAQMIADMHYGPHQWQNITIGERNFEQLTGCERVIIFDEIYANEKFRVETATRFKEIVNSIPTHVYGSDIVGIESNKHSSLAPDIVFATSERLLYPAALSGINLPSLYNREHFRYEVTGDDEMMERLGLKANHKDVQLTPDDQAHLPWLRFTEIFKTEHEETKGETYTYDQVKERLVEEVHRRKKIFATRKVIDKKHDIPCQVFYDLLASNYNSLNVVPPKGSDIERKYRALVDLAAVEIQDDLPRLAAKMKNPFAKKGAEKTCAMCATNAELDHRDFTVNNNVHHLTLEGDDHDGEEGWAYQLSLAKHTYRFIQDIAEGDVQEINYDPMPLEMVNAAVSEADVKLRFARQKYLKYYNEARRARNAYFMKSLGYNDSEAVSDAVKTVGSLALGAAALGGFYTLFKWLLGPRQPKYVAETYDVRIRRQQRKVQPTVAEAHQNSMLVNYAILNVDRKTDDPDRVLPVRCIYVGNDRFLTYAHWLPSDDSALDTFSYSITYGDRTYKLPERPKFYTSKAETAKDICVFRVSTNLSPASYFPNLAKTEAGVLSSAADTLMLTPGSRAQYIPEVIECSYQGFDIVTHVPKVYVIENALSVPIPSISGDCGKALLDQANRIVGILVAGTISGQTASMFQVVSKEQVDLLCPVYEPHCPASWKDPASYPVCRGSRLHATSLRHACEEKAGTRFYKPPMSAATSAIGVDPKETFIQRLKECTNETLCDQTLINRAKADLVHLWTLEDRHYPVPSMRDAVCGYHCLNSLDLDTSMAWPLGLETKDPALSGKRSFIRVVDDEILTSPAFDKRLAEVTEYITKGKPCRFYTVCAFKDEPLKESKYLENRPRVIMPSDAVLNVYMRARLAPLLSDFYDFTRNHNMAIGVNIESLDAELMLHHLKFLERPGRFVDADYSAFDLTIPRPYLEAAYDVLEKIVAHSGLMSAEEFHRYAAVNLDPVIYFDGDCIKPRSINTSGNLFTTIVNCIVNELYLRSAFYYYHPNSDFDSNVSCLFYGDDMLFTVGPDLDLTFPMYQKFCARLGLKVTPGDKSDVVHDYLTLDQVTFLSHNFHKTPFGYMGALSMSHFYRALSYSFESDICSDALESLIRAIAAQPEPVFNEAVTWLRSISPISVPYNVGSRDLLLHKLYQSSAVINRLPVAMMPFVLDHDSVEEETSEVIPRDLSSVPEEPVEMYDAATAPFEVAHFEWDASQTAGTELWNAQMPCLPPVQTLASMPLFTTHFSNFHCAVTFKITASRFSRGLLVAYLEPLGSKSAGRPLHLKDMLTVPHVFMTPMNSDNAQLVQGFISPRNLYQNALIFNRTQFSGWLHIAVFSPYADDQTSPQAASITVFARYVDMKTFQARRFKLTAAGIGKQLCKTVERTARLAGTVADLIGLDAPEEVGQPQVVTQRYMPLSNVDGVRDTNELRENEAAFDGRARENIFLGGDMLLSDLISRPFLLTSFTWTADKGSGSILNMFYLNCVPGVTGYDDVVPAPVSFLNLATFWHCDFAITLKFVKNAYSTGRLRITTVYGPQAPTAADIPYYKGDLINVDAEVDSYSFVFSYLALTDYLRTFEGFKRIEDVPEDYDLGSVTTTVMNPIHAIEGVSATCDVLVICEMINIDTRVPRPVPFLRAAGLGRFAKNTIKRVFGRYHDDGHQSVYYLRSRYSEFNVRIPCDWVCFKNIGTGFVCSLHNYLEANGLQFGSFYVYRYDELIGICCDEGVYSSDDILFFKVTLASMPAPKPAIYVENTHGEFRSALLGPVQPYSINTYDDERVIWIRCHDLYGAKGDCGSPLHLYRDGQLYWVGSLHLLGGDLSACYVGYCTLRKPLKPLGAGKFNLALLLHQYGMDVANRFPPGFLSSEPNDFFSTTLGVDDMGNEEGGFASDEESESDEMVSSQFAYQLTDITDFVRRGIVLPDFRKSWTETNKAGVVTTVFPVEPHFGFERYYRAWSGSIHYRIVNLGDQATPIRVSFYPGGSGANTMTFSGLFSTDVVKVNATTIPVIEPPEVARPPLELAYRVCPSNEYIDFAIPFQTIYHFIELNEYVQTAPLGYVAIQGLTASCQVYTYAGDDFSYGFFYPVAHKFIAPRDICRAPEPGRGSGNVSKLNEFLEGL
uniref:Genome polyprotein n=1 Tax=Posavirus 3 TaxID=1663127 RepID=A0A166HRW3_9VIRU|nr:polyprotein [Posavirus 3]